jgi:3'(2'), 5'-bisphosphate nucleotidase
MIDKRLIAQWLDHLLPTVISVSDLLVEQQSYIHPEDIETKADGSRVTRMDRLSHHLLLEALDDICPGIPVLSEEGEMPSFEERQGWTTYWCIDPLDGTRNYLEGSSHFAISIGLIHNHQAIAGCLAAPADRSVFVACPQRGAFEWNMDNSISPLKTAPMTHAPRILVSSDPRYIDQPAVLCTFPGASFIPMGSALKYIALARGDADCYLRRAPFCEWDCAAGQALVTLAGGCVVDKTGATMDYNRTESVLRDYILACSCTELFETIQAYLEDASIDE